MQLYDPISTNVYWMSSCNERNICKIIIRFWRIFSTDWLREGNVQTINNAVMLELETRYVEKRIVG